jgi:hypothetical protein
MQFSEQLTTLYVESYTFKSEKYYNCANTDQVLIKGNLLTDNECYFAVFCSICVNFSFIFYIIIRYDILLLMKK